MGFFVPDCYFNTVYDITPEFLKSKGIEGIILDIDNTLVPYEIPEPTSENLMWLSAMDGAGIKYSFVSNNHRERVELFNKNILCPAFYDSGKPLKKSCRRALDAMALRPEKTAIIGDQIFTDVLAGRFAGLGLTVLVKPIKDKTSLFFRFKRFLEKPVLKAYIKREKKKQRKMK